MHRPLAALPLFLSLAALPALAAKNSAKPAKAKPQPTAKAKVPTKFAIRHVYPRRIEVDTVLEIHGRGFVAKGAAPTIQIKGVIEDADGAHPVSFQTQGIFESSKLIVYKFTYKDFEKMGRKRGKFRGALNLFCPLGNGRSAVGTKVVAASVFPPTIRALAEEAIHAGVVPTINKVMTWALLGILWLALAAVFIKLFLFQADRPRMPDRSAPKSELGKYLIMRGPAVFLLLLSLAALAGGAYALSGPISKLLGELTGLSYAIHLGLGFLAAFVVVNVALLYAGPVTWVERRVAARMQSRVGPNRVGPQGLLQWLADGLKAIMKEDIVPSSADPVLFRVAPYLVFSAIFATFSVLPFSATWVATDLNVGVLFVLSVTSIVVPGLIMAGWSSNNKWSLFGGMRAAAQIVSYEIPASLAILTVIVYVGSLSMQDIIRAQGGAPWNWFVFHNPFTFIAFFLFFTSALAEGNRAPFDLPEAESELVSGYNTEYSGMRFLLFFVAEYVNIYVMSAIATTIFLGGWRIPLVSVAAQEQSIGLQFLGLMIFWAKVSVLSFVVIWLRWTLPRLRVDQLMTMCWKFFVPITFVCFLGSAVWYMAFGELGLIDKILRIVLFLGGAALVSFLFYRAYWHFKHTKAKVFAKPFI